MRIALLFLSLASFSCFAQSTPKFTKKQVLSDLKSLMTSLEEAHYDMYVYTPKEKIDSIYRELSSSVKEDSLSLLKTTNLLQRLTSAVNNGHTEIFFPISSYLTYAEGGGTVFPIEIAFENDRALIRKNWSDIPELEPGTEVISIDEMSISELLEKFYLQVSAERPYFKNAKIEFYSIPRMYWQVFGEKENFSVEAKIEEEIKKYEVKPVKVFDGYEGRRTEVLNASMQLKFLEGAAYLNPGNLFGDEDKYRKFIDSSFAAIQESKASNLIIDLRNNQGGDDSFGDYMVSYIADKPFQWSSEFTLKTSSFLKDNIRKTRDTTSTFWASALTHEDGEVYPYEFEPFQPQPAEKRFTGKVFVLVNRQSHSQSTVTASQIQDYGFGTIVGEETGEFPTLYASVFKFQLPETGIEVQVSKGYMVRVNGSREARGVVPDIFIQDHLLDEQDEILEGLLEKINTDR